MPIKKNDRIKLNIESCTADGSGVGHYEGMAIFVPASAVGDEIIAHVLKVKKTYAFAKVESVEVPSPHRVDPVCPVYLKCGGCVFSHIDYAEECRIKAENVRECFRRIGGVEPEFEEMISSEKTEGYRNKAQYPVAMDKDGMRMGFFSSHSHRVIHCPGCSLQPAEFEKILGIFEKYIKQYGVSVYDEASHSGALRHIYLRKASATGEIMVCAVVNGNRLPAENELVSMLTAAGEKITSIILNSNKEKTNVILGSKCRTLFGADHITDILCSLKFEISPLSFYQVNRDQAERLYAKAAEYAALTGNETVMDLYCGAGTIGLSMASKAKRIIGVEIVPEAVEDAKRNAELNGIKNAEFICGDAAKAAAELEKEGIKPDVIILDPPRKGCSPEMVHSAVRFAPERIVYVSCDPATLARDCALFKELGYTPVKATPVDMFPRTGHVESVVLLVKLPPDDVVNIELDLTKLPVSIHDGDATYDEIKKYVLSHHGLKVSSLYISQIKRKYGLKVTEAYNKPKSENSRQPQCPPEKEKAITEALKYFKMISN